MTSGTSLVDIRHFGAATPDGGQVAYATQHLYSDLLGFAGGPSGMRVIVPDLVATAKRVPTADNSVRYEVKSANVLVVLEAASGGDQLVMRYASLLDDAVVKWWAGLNDDQRSRVKKAAKEAAEKHDFSLAGVQVLIDTNCPVGPVGTKWDNNTEYAWSWPESLQQFVIDQD